jgi:phytoene dehydrogenase-like protein
VSLAAASKHVQVLERAGLISRTVTGRRHVCRLRPRPLASASAWLSFYQTHWEQSLDALEDLLAPASEPKGDSMTTSTDAIRLQRTIPASPARVYRAWLDPDLVSRWMAVWLVHERLEGLPSAMPQVADSIDTGRRWCSTGSPRL